MGFQIILSHPLLQSPRLLPRYPIPSSFLYTSVTMAPLTTELTTPITGTYQQPIGLFIDGKWVEGVDKKKFEVINPSTEETITSICEGTEKDIDLAVAAARKAFEGEWKKISPQQRGNLLLKLADLADKIEGKTIDIAPDMFHYTRSEPIGVCGQIIPWNFPLLMLAWKIGPALATGNTIVMKTAEQ